jgi:hypothetical protein
LHREFTGLPAVGSRLSNEKAAASTICCDQSGERQAGSVSIIVEARWAKRLKLEIAWI